VDESAWLEPLLASHQNSHTAVITPLPAKTTLAGIGRHDDRRESGSIEGSPQSLSAAPRPCPSPKYRLALPPWQYRFNAEIAGRWPRPGRNDLSVLWLAARSRKRQ